MTDLITLAECPPGVFEFKGSLGFKTEYGATIHGPVGWEVSHWPEAYCLESGEVFWGGVKTHPERAKLMVRPVDLPTWDAYMRACRALHWRTAQLRALGVEPIPLSDDMPHDPPDDAFEDRVQEWELFITERAIQRGRIKCQSQ